MTNPTPQEIADAIANGRHGPVMALPNSAPVAWSVPNLRDTFAMHAPAVPEAFDPVPYIPIGKTAHAIGEPEYEAEYEIAKAEARAETFRLRMARECRWRYQFAEAMIEARGGLPLSKREAMLRTALSDVLDAWERECEAGDGIREEDVGVRVFAQSVLASIPREALPATAAPATMPTR